MVRSQAKQRHDEILGGHGEWEPAPRSYRSTKTRGSIQPPACVDVASSGAARPSAIRRVFARTQSEVNPSKPLLQFMKPELSIFPGQPAQSDTLERNERNSRKLPEANEPVPDSRGQGRGTLLEVGGTLIAKAGDRIDAAVEVLRGLRVFDQPRAEIDEGIQVVDLLQPALGLSRGNSVPSKSRAGRSNDRCGGLERTRNPGQLGEPGIQRGCSPLELRQPVLQPVPSAAALVGSACSQVSRLAELARLRAGPGAKDSALELGSRAVLGSFGCAHRRVVR